MANNRNGADWENPNSFKFGSSQGADGPDMTLSSSFCLHSNYIQVPMIYTNTFNIVTCYKCYSTDKYNNLFAYIPITFRVDWKAA